MTKVVLLSLILVVAFAVLYAQRQVKKLDVLVLYESLCPDSISFMRNQLKPSYDDFKDYIDITLVPFGKSESQNNGANFICQHGPAECRGNRMQSCVLHQTADQAAQVKFAICQMVTPDKQTVEECAEASGLSGDIDNCMQTELGTHLQLQAEQITKMYAPTFVPTIIYDRVFNQQLQRYSLRDFRGTICYLLQQRGVISFHDEVCL